MQQKIILWESTRKKHWYHTGERNSYSKLQTDGKAKLSWRDHEFSKAGRLVRSEDLSGELQGEPGEPQPTESKNDAEVRADFWSIQGDFIYRQHNEPRVQLRVPKEEAFFFHWNTLIEQGLLTLIRMSCKRTYWWQLECRLEQKFVGFLERIHKVHSIERETSQRTYVVREEADKSSNDYETRSCMAWSTDQNLESRSVSRTTWME